MHLQHTDHNKELGLSLVVTLSKNEPTEEDGNSLFLSMGDREIMFSDHYYDGDLPPDYLATALEEIQGWLVKFKQDLSNPVYADLLLRTERTKHGDYLTYAREEGGDCIVKFGNDEDDEPIEFAIVNGDTSVLDGLMALFDQGTRLVRAVYQPAVN